MTSKVCITRATAIAGVLLALSLPAVAGQTVRVELWNKADGTQGLTLTPSTVKAGSVTFDIVNQSTNLVHEFLVYKTDESADAMPMSDDGAKVDEEKIPGFKEAGHLDPGTARTWTTDLKPGLYLASCNQDGHYMAGMHTMLIVMP